MNQRSEPGQGSICGIYLLGPGERMADDVVRTIPGTDTVLCYNKGEDFADTLWPVVVKAKADVTREQLAQYLRDLASAVERGNFISIDMDKDTLIEPNPFGTSFYGAS